MKVLAFISKSHLCENLTKYVNIWKSTRYCIATQYIASLLTNSLLFIFNLSDLIFLKFFSAEILSKGIRDSLLGFTNGKFCLPNLVAFYNGMIASLGSRRATDLLVHPVRILIWFPL